jgi:hypothetical protein
MLRRATLPLLAVLLLAGCAPSEEESDFLARKALLERQNLGIRELIAEEEKGTLVTPDRFIIGIDEGLVGDIFRYQLPIERPLGKRFLLHLDKASISLRDKFGVIILDGDVHRPETPDRKVQVRIHGGLGAIDIDTKANVLNLRVAVDRIELLQAGMLDAVLGKGGRKLIADKSLPLLQDALPTFHIPVALAQDLKVPALQSSAIALDSLVVPLDLSVERVIAASGKLWVTLDAKVGKVTGAENGLGVSVKGKKKKAAAGGGK